ncbi:hypothetical protein [Streptomyces sp. NPDC089919]|uniref:HAAS signaling domain-containing protein n=1 Tax=Streptomyces sp. NPDC089919 TaxID=3155188 RepID=UPI0034177B97
MMTTEHPLVRDYLAAVAAETEALPAERRTELLADLREHIESSGEAGDEARIREVLGRLGDPRTVAASAFAEELPRAAAPTRTALVAQKSGLTRVTVVLLAVSGLLCLTNAAVGGVTLLVGLGLLWTSPAWDGRRKALGTATSAGTPLLALTGGLLLAGRVGALELLLLMAALLVVPLCGAVSLSRAARA